MTEAMQACASIAWERRGMYLQMLGAQLGSTIGQNAAQAIDLVQGSQALGRVRRLRQAAEHAGHFSGVRGGYGLGRPCHHLLLAYLG